MEQYFEIYGTLIKLASIKDFGIIQREYIYRPTYTEAEKSIINKLSGKRYTFLGMQPYAAILDEKGRKYSVNEYQTKNFKESVGKDLFEGAVTTIADKFNIKAFKSKKYVCVNQAGRTFTTYLEDVPALVMSLDGKASDVYKNDEMYPLLGEPIAPAVDIVHALQINTKQKEYLFYGNGIQLNDIGKEYERLKSSMRAYEEEKKSDKLEKIIGGLPHVMIPKFNKKSDKSESMQLEDKK